ncbi:hypothetical protein CC86DRAFT_400514 [Ophiobolus disseminans]|uniref:Uncharacterized protein n=1 Tax=Ophiobolus disseminans TaxID=1469910 RepID=A0A6A7AKX5_9PLEO|nr:hypothetical protein CC86DRAFT_400514 [Ophiobolus disseminans]
MSHSMPMHNNDFGTNPPSLTYGCAAAAPHANPYTIVSTSVGPASFTQPYPSLGKPYGGSSYVDPSGAMNQVPADQYAANGGGMCDYGGADRVAEHPEYAVNLNVDERPSNQLSDHVGMHPLLIPTSGGVGESTVEAPSHPLLARPPNACLDGTDKASNVIGVQFSIPSGRIQELTTHVEEFRLRLDASLASTIKDVSTSTRESIKEITAAKRDITTWRQDVNEYHGEAALVNQLQLAVTEPYAIITVTISGLARRNHPTATITINILAFVATVYLAYRLDGDLDYHFIHFHVDGLYRFITIDLYKLSAFASISAACVCIIMIATSHIHTQVPTDQGRSSEQPRIADRIVGINTNPRGNDRHVYDYRHLDSATKTVVRPRLLVEDANYDIYGKPYADMFQATVEASLQVTR